MSKLTQEQAEELGVIARELTVLIGGSADAFCQKHRMQKSGDAFYASLFTLIETITFVTLTSAFRDDPVQQRQTADELLKGVKKLLRDYATHKQIEKLRNHPKGQPQ